MYFGMSFRSEFWKMNNAFSAIGIKMINSNKLVNKKKWNLLINDDKN